MTERPVPASPALVQLRDLVAAHVVAPDVDRFDRWVGRVSALVDALAGEVDESWREELRSAWWRLEHVDALALGEERDALTAEEVEAVTEGRRDLLALLGGGPRRSWMPPDALT